MKLSLAKAPQGGAAMIRQAFERIHGSALCPDAHCALDLDQFWVGVPHHVHQLDLDASGTVSADRLRPDGTRFLIKAADQMVATGHVSTGPDASIAGEFTQISFGPRAAAFADAIARGEKLPGKGEWEVALLSVAALHVQALLLLPKGDKNEPHVLTVDAPKQFGLPDAATLAQFCQALTPAAAAFVASSGKPPKAD